MYSFGVVLLEILSGSGAIRKHSNGAMRDLALWAVPFLSNKMDLQHLIDKRLKNNAPMKEACELAELILSCLCSCHKQRPTMAQVVATLERLEKKSGLHNQRSHGRT